MEEKLSPCCDVLFFGFCGVPVRVFGFPHVSGFCGFLFLFLFLLSFFVLVSFLYNSCVLWGAFTLFIKISAYL